MANLSNEQGRETQEVTAVFDPEDVDRRLSIQETILKEKLDTLKIQLHRNEDFAQDVKLSRWTRTLKLSPLLLLYFVVSFCLAFTGPFTSSLTAEKRLDKWQFTVIFASSKVTILLGTLLVIVLMQNVKPHWLMVASLIGVSVSLAVTGCLSWIPDGSAFIGTSTLIGALYGFFYAFFTVTLYSMATYRCQRSCGIIISTLEFLYGTGTISGALAGVAVLDSWNYPIVFFVSAGLLLAGLPFLIFCSPGKDVEVTKNNQNFFRLIGSAPMVVDFVNVLLVMSAIGFHDGTLEFRLQYEEFRLSVTEVGAVFAVLYVFYVFGALFWGYVSSYKWEKEHVTILLGFVLLVLSFGIVGPAPFLPFEPRLWLVYIAQALCGAGASAVVVCSFSRAIKRAVERGFPDNMWTFGSVVGFLFAGIAIGAGVSPLLSRFATENIQYRRATSIMLAVLAFWCIVGLGSCIVGCRRRATLIGSRGPKEVYHKKNAF